MIRWFQFYRLLGIPDEVSEPTFYDILGISRETCTAEAVQQALQERKKKLRQNIPGPQFIALVLKFENEQLEPAARVLGDPIQRRAYDRELEQTKQDQNFQQTQRQKVQAAREAIAEAVGTDGTLTQRRRFTLAERLWEIGLTEEDVQAILLRIPSSRDEPGEDTEGMASKREFFESAVDLALAEGFLNEQEQQKLLQLAENLRIPSDVAKTLIEERIHFQAIEIQRREQQVLGEEFELQVQMLHPDGVANAVQQEYLYQSGLNKGLPGERVREILKRCLSLSEESILGEKESDGRKTKSKLKGIGEPVGRGGRFHDVRNVLLLIFLMILLAGGLLTLLYSLGEPRRPTVLEERTVVEPPAVQSEEEVAPPEAQENLPAERVPPIEIQSELLKKLLALRNSPELWVEILGTYPSPAVQEAMHEAGQVLLRGETEEVAKQVQVILESLLVLPEHASLHAAIIRSVLESGSSAGDSGSLCLPLQLLSKFILLTGWECSEDFERARERLALCEREWQKSLVRFPEHPLADPQRLADAVWAGGKLDDVLVFADEAEYTAVSIQLADKIADAEDAQETPFFQRMVRRAKDPSVQPAFICQTARLSLCEILRKTQNERLAEAVFFELAKLVGIHNVRAIVSSDFRSAEFRNRTAAMLESFFLIGVRPDQYRENMFPHFTKRRVADATGKDFRQHYSVSDRNEDILKDIAITMLGCTDLCRQYSGAVSGWSESFQRVLDSNDPIGALVQNISFVKPDAEDLVSEELLSFNSVDLEKTGPAGGGYLEGLWQDLISDSPEKQYPAIEQLRQAGNIQATDYLLQSLKEENMVGHEGTVCRVLRALRTIPDRRIPQMLVELIHSSRSGFLRYNVVRVLREEMQGSVEPEGVLPVNHTAEQQETCYQWWRGVVSEMNFRWGSGKPVYPPVRSQKVWDSSRWRGSREEGQGEGGTQELWMEDDRLLKLLARISFFAQEMADRLDQPNREGMGEKQPPGISFDLPISISRLAVGADLTESMKRLTSSLERMVRTHPKGKEFAMQADVLWLRHHARLLACQTALQETAVWMETQGALLEILRREGRLDLSGHETLQQIAQQREIISAIAPNVLYEIREHAYCNLSLWNMLAESRLSEPAKGN